MKRKLKMFGAGLALAAVLTTAANATIYTWDPVPGNPHPSSGKLTYDGTSVTSISWFWGSAPLETVFNGGAAVLTDGDLLLNGTSIDPSGTGSDVAYWFPAGVSPDENGAIPGAFSFEFKGNWVPGAAVPEPATFLAGALLLLPFVAGTIRVLRKARVA